MHDVELAGPGMRIRNSPLFLDAQRPADLSFVSHAHFDHLARHRQMIGTAATLRLVAHRLGEVDVCLPAPFGQTFEVGDMTLDLLPAGHVLGSAQLRVTRKGRRIAYTGDLNPVPGLTAEPAEVARCDLLVLESTFGHPRYAFPPREETWEAMRNFARRALEESATPVFLGYPLGKSQEAMQVIAAGGFALAAHPEIASVCEVYAELGKPIPHRVFDGEVRRDEALFWPAGMAKALSTALKGRFRTAALTGWAVEGGARYRLGTDEAFPLSDHADFEGLVRYARETGARKVLTVHGFTAELAACLRDRGIDAQPLIAPRQLELF